MPRHLAAYFQLRPELAVALAGYQAALERRAGLSKADRRRALAHEVELLEALDELDALRSAVAADGVAAGIAARIGVFGAPMQEPPASVPGDEVTTTKAAELLGIQSRSFLGLARRRRWVPYRRSKPIVWSLADVLQERDRQRS
jgi:hypothetical protein